MPFYNSKNAYVSVAGTDISAFCDNASLDRTNEQADTTPFQQAHKSSQSGLNSATYSIAGKYDPTATTGPAAVLTAAALGGVAVSVVHRPEGTGSGLEQNAFSAILTSYKESTTAGDTTKFEAAFEVTGTITDTTQ
jgi:hypothetical protein